jgi:hypothetical protein
MYTTTVTDPAGKDCFSVQSNPLATGNDWFMRWTDARGDEVARQVFDLTYGLYVICDGDSNRYLVNWKNPAECLSWVALISGSPDPSTLQCQYESYQSCDAVEACGVGGVNVGRDAAAD